MKFNSLNIGTLAAAALISIATPALATQQSGERQDSRNVRQEGRQVVQEAKIDCMVDSNKSNPECRQDKRDAKQGVREAARDVKY